VLYGIVGWWPTQLAVTWRIFENLDPGQRVAAGRAATAEPVMTLLLAWEKACRAAMRSNAPDRAVAEAKEAIFDLAGRKSNF
jgi:hypothetical protein